LDTTAFATALALEYMQRQLNVLKDSWELIAVKAKKWLTLNFSNTYGTIRAQAGQVLTVA